MTDPGWYHAEGDPAGTTRYWDGAQWVGEAVPNPAAGPSAVGTGERDGKLTAAGIMSLISGGVVALIALWIIAVANSSEWDFVDDLSGSAFTLIGVFLLAVAGLYIAAGVGCVRGQGWGRIMSIVVESIVLALFLIGFIASIGDAGSDVVGQLIPIAWTGTILGLSITGKAWS